jgi:hypothetical protein
LIAWKSAAERLIFTQGGHAPQMATVSTLYTFTNTGPAQIPFGGLLVDAAGDLFGTTTSGGVGGRGILFELVNNGDGSYTFSTLVTAATEHIQRAPSSLIPQVICSVRLTGAGLQTATERSSRFSRRAPATPVRQSRWSISMAATAQVPLLV